VSGFKELVCLDTKQSVRRSEKTMLGLEATTRDVHKTEGLKDEQQGHTSECDPGLQGQGSFMYVEGEVVGERVGEGQGEAVRETETRELILEEKEWKARWAQITSRISSKAITHQPPLSLALLGSKSRPRPTIFKPNSAPSSSQSVPTVSLASYSSDALLELVFRLLKSCQDGKEGAMADVLFDVLFVERGDSDAQWVGFPLSLSLSLSLSVSLSSSLSHYLCLSLLSLLSLLQL
jgi:hypothetical protein